MKLNLVKNLKALRDAASLKVDLEAETERGKYITLGSGQAMVYLEKERQAESVSKDPEINPYLVPLIHDEANRLGCSRLDAAIVVLTMAHTWRTIGAAIDDKRLRAKDQITAATNPAAIAQASNVDWEMSV